MAAFSTLASFKRKPGSLTPPTMAWSELDEVTEVPSVRSREIVHQNPPRIEVSNSGPMDLKSASQSYSYATTLSCVATAKSAIEHLGSLGIGGTILICEGAEVCPAEFYPINFDRLAGFVGGTVPMWDVLAEDRGDDFLDFTPATPNRSAPELLLSEIGRMRDGWDCVGSVAPSLAAQDTLARILPMLTAALDRAEIEIDPSAGDVSLRWYSPRSRAVLSITALQSGDLVAAHTPREGVGTAWTSAANHSSAIASVLRHVDLLNDTW